MIFNRSFQHELNYTSGAVFLILLNIMLATIIIRIVGLASIGNADPSQIIVLIGLQIVRYVAILLIATLYISITIVLTRWQKDGEINIWLFSGIRIFDFFKSLLQFTFPFILLITFFALTGWPWANKKQTELYQQFRQGAKIAFIIPGQFHESLYAQRVFFVERLNPIEKKLNNVFTAKIKKNGFEVIIADKGELKIDKNGDRYIILNNGTLYDNNPGKVPFKVAHFQQYGIIINDPILNNATLPIKSKSTLSLLKKTDNAANGELFWRVSLIFMTVILMIAAVPVTLYKTRKKGSFHFVIAALIFFTYFNLLNLIKAKITQTNLNLLNSFIVLHGSTGFISTIFFLKTFNSYSYGKKVIKKIKQFINLHFKQKRGYSEDL